MSIIRRIKISKITNKALKKKDKECVEFIESMLSDLIILDDIHYKNWIGYFNKDHKYVFEYYKGANIACIKLEGFWSVLELKFKYYGAKEIYPILKYFIEKNFNIKVDKISCNSISRGNHLEYILNEHFKQLNELNKKDKD